MNYAPTPNVLPPVAGFLLAGGASSRMGQDKALLLINEKPLLVNRAELLKSVSSEFHLLAPPDRYESFGYHTIADRWTGCGPLAGIEAALAETRLDWNLFLACDLALVGRDWLITLITAAWNSTELHVVASAACPNKPNPLCAMWHKSALPTVQAALKQNNLRVRSALDSLKTQILIPSDPGILSNWNRPEDLPAEFGGGKANRGG